MLGAKPMGAPTPKVLHSVEVHNKMSEPVTVTVTFDNHKDKTDMKEEHQIANGASHHFQEKSLDMGTWQAVAPVKLVSVTHANGSTSMEPTVQGIVKKMELSVVGNGSIEIL